MAARQVASVRFTAVLKSWPANPSMKGRDLGEHLAAAYQTRLEKGKVANVNEALDSLEKLSSNYYWKRYRRKINYSYCDGLASGNVLSNANLESLKRQSLWSRIKTLFYSS